MLFNKCLYTFDITELSSMENITEKLNWRYATKKFDSTKKLSEEQFDALKEALRLSPSSYGLQPYKFLVIDNPEIRLQLQHHSWNQAQITEASHLIVFCSFIQITERDIDQHIENTAKIRSIDASTLEGFRLVLRKNILEMQPEAMSEWNSKQCYIALGQLLFACAQLGIDATPMEGFSPDGYDAVLGLKEQNLKAVLVCPVGFRSAEDNYQFNKKVRKSKENLFVSVG